MIEKRRYQPVYSPLSLRLRVQWRVGLLLAALVFSIAARAADLPVYACWDWNGSACVGGAEDHVLYSTLGPTDAIYVCTTGIVGRSAHTGCTGTLGFVQVSELSDEHLVEFGDGSTGSTDYGRWLPASHLNATGSGGGSSGGDISEADLSEAGTWFAAAFVLVVMLWGMGKGIGLIASVVRGR